MYTLSLDSVCDVIVNAKNSGKQWTTQIMHSGGHIIIVKGLLIGMRDLVKNISQNLQKFLLTIFVTILIFFWFLMSWTDKKEEWHLYNDYQKRQEQISFILFPIAALNTVKHK